MELIVDNTAPTPENGLISFGTSLGHVWDGQNDEETSSDPLENMRSDLLDSLGRDELLNRKGLKAITKLIKTDDARAVIRHAIKSSNGDKVQYVEGLKRLLSQYNSSASISSRSICDVAATDGVSGKWLERNILPLLVELGIIVKAGEKSYHWQAWDKIGHKLGMVDLLKASLAVTPDKLALRAAQAKAANEARMLQLAKKQAAIAQHRKTTLMQATNAAQEAERLAASLPTGNEGASGWIKSNPILVAVLALAGVVAVGGNISGGGVPGSGSDMPLELATISPQPVVQPQPDTVMQPTPAPATTRRATP